MIDKLITNTRIIEKALDAAWMRNEATTSNIANVDTPGYKRKSVKFEEFFKDNVEFAGKTAKKDEVYEPKIVQDNSDLEYRLDGNNVDIEAEMALMAKNYIKYNILIEGLSGRYRSIKYVIGEGRR